MFRKSRVMWVAVVVAGAITCMAAVNHFQTAATSEKQRPAQNSQEDGWTNTLSVSSPAYREAEKYHQWLLNNKKLEIANGSAGPIEKLNLSGRLGAKGMARLPTDLLEQNFPLVGRVLASLQDHICGNFIRGSASASEFKNYAFPVLESFNDADAKIWFETNRAAVEAMLNDSPNIILPKEKAKQGILKIAESLPATQSRAFLSGLAALRTVNDAEACATARTLFDKGASLPEPYLGYMARLLLTGREGDL